MERVLIKNYWGLSLIELLVVIAILGIIGIIAFPNFKNYLSERKVRSNVWEIVSLIDEVKNSVRNGNNVMGQVFINSNNGNGVIVQTKYRDQSLFNSNSSCNNHGGIPASSNKSFSTLKSSKSGSVCISKDGNYTGSDLNNYKNKFGNYNTIILCDSGSTSSASCGTNTNSTFQITYNRHAEVEVSKWSEQSNGWILQAK